MRSESDNLLSATEKEYYISALTKELLILRTKTGLTQEELSNLIGVSRQTYSAIEIGRRKMQWSVFVALIFIFDSIEKTHDFIRIIDLFPDSLISKINFNALEENEK